ncbi:MAG: GAF domain-containing SpoIIE family protein phosphatase [Bacteroidota bacterium]
MNFKNEEDHISSLQSENKNLRKAVQELSVLNDIASAINSTNSVDSIINLIVNKSIKHLKVEQCVVMLLDKEEKNAEFHTMIRRADDSKINLPFKLDTQLSGWMIQNKKPLLINDLIHDKRFLIQHKADMPINSLLCTPLIVKGELIGLISVFNKKHDEEFSKNDERLLSIIASQSASVLENARLYEEEQQLISMKEEMRLARNIQLNLLPSKLPVIEGYEIFASSTPAKDVGGDYYDFVELSNNKMAFCLGDITGKGLPAAMLMSNLQATLRGQILTTAKPCECITNANKLLYNSTEPDKFATLFYGVLDHHSDNVAFCNAGHDNPIIISTDGELKNINTGGLLMGALSESNYDDDKVILNDGDVLVVYSDGITEAMNENSEEFTLGRLEKILKDNVQLSANELHDTIFMEVRLHTKNAVQSDDITLLIIKKL